MSSLKQSLMGRSVLDSATAFALPFIVVFSISSPAWAVTKTPASGTGAAAGVITNPGKMWVSGHILHIRGQVEEQTVVSGDLVGTQHLVLNLDLDTRTGRANVHNIVTLDVLWVSRGISGRLRGHFAGHARGPNFVGKIAYEGSGGFSGMKMLTTASGVLGQPFNYTGVMLEP